MSKSGYATIEKSQTVLNTFKTFEVKDIDKNSTSVSGKGLKDATVKAYVDNKQIGKTAKVDSKGNYKISIPKQKSGKDVVVKMSKSGYATTEKKVKVKNLFGTFTINSISTKSTSVSGKGLKSAEIKIYVDKKQIGKTTKVSSSGTYKVSVPKQKSGKKIVVKMSKSGYKTVEKSVTVKK